MHGQHRFVGGNHMLARRDCRFDRGLGGAIFAPHQFDEHIHIVPLGQSNRIVFPRIGRQIDAPITLARTCGNRRNADRATSPARQHFCVFFNDFDGAGADSSKASNSKAQGISHVSVSGTRVIHRAVLTGFSDWRNAMRRVVSALLTLKRSAGL